MIISMTGYGRASATGEGYVVDCELKTFNNKFLDISLRLPSILNNREYDLRELIRSGIRRGKVYVSIQMKQENGGAIQFAPDSGSIDSFITGLKKVKKDHKLKDSITLSHLLTFRDLFTAQAAELSEEAFEVVKNTINGAIENLYAMRKAEGEQLSADIAARLVIIEGIVGEVETLTKSGVNEQFEKLKQRAKELLENSSQFSERLEMELALLADRADVTEECVRIRSHIKYMRESLQSSEESGKRLNFLCQELNREANTISSKSATAEVTFAAVKIKEEVERIREQVQNLE